MARTDRRRRANQPDARRERRRRWASVPGASESRAVLSESMWVKRACEMSTWRSRGGRGRRAEGPRPSDPCGGSLRRRRRCPSLPGTAAPPARTPWPRSGGIAWGAAVGWGREGWIGEFLVGGRKRNGDGGLWRKEEVFCW